MESSSCCCRRQRRGGRGRRRARRGPRTGPTYTGTSCSTSVLVLGSVFPGAEPFLQALPALRRANHKTGNPPKTLAKRRRLGLLEDTRNAVAAGGVQDAAVAEPERDVV